MKKKLVLIILLMLPIAFYIFFAMAKHNSLFLPVLKKDLQELPQGETLTDSAVYLKGKITILGFLGNDVAKRKETIFNLGQKIYERYGKFKDFQMVIIMPNGTQQEIKTLTYQLSAMADLSHWKFLFLTDDTLAAYYKSLNVKEPLDASLGTNYVFIVDKDRALRGRKGSGGKEDDEYKDGYNAFSPYDLSDAMVDDVKILLREYRLALKKNEDKRQI